MAHGPDPADQRGQPFRLQDDAVRGLTICRADVLTDAVEADAERLLGVADASAVLRGTARQPELTLKVTVNDRTDIQRLLHSLQPRQWPAWSAPWRRR